MRDPLGLRLNDAAGSRAGSVREQKLLPLQEAIRKLTGLPASRAIMRLKRHFSTDLVEKNDEHSRQ